MRYDFASREWLDALRQSMESRALAAGDELAGINFAMCEVFTNVPPAIDATGHVAWHCRVGEGQLLWSLGEADNVDFKLVGEWASILPVARLVYSQSPDGEEVASRLIARAVREGRVTVTGRRPDGLGFLSEVHDDVARITA